MLILTTIIDQSYWLFSTGFSDFLPESDTHRVTKTTLDDSENKNYNRNFNSRKIVQA